MNMMNMNVDKACFITAFIGLLYKYTFLNARIWDIYKYNL